MEYKSIQYYLNKKLDNTGFKMGAFNQKLEKITKEDLFKIYPYIFDSTVKKAYIEFFIEGDTYFVGVNTHKKEKDFLCVDKETYQRLASELNNSK